MLFLPWLPRVIDGVGSYTARTHSDINDVGNWQVRWDEAFSVWESQMGFFDRLELAPETYVSATSNTAFG